MFYFCYLCNKHSNLTKKVTLKYKVGQVLDSYSDDRIHKMRLSGMFYKTLH